MDKIVSGLELNCLFDTRYCGRVFRSMKPLAPVFFLSFVWPNFESTDYVTSMDCCSFIANQFSISRWGRVMVVKAHDWTECNFENVRLCGS